MRSFFAFAAALYFGFIGVSGMILQGDPNRITGDPTQSTINGTMAMLYVGLAILSLAIVEWGQVRRAVSRLAEKPEADVPARVRWPR